MALPAHTIHRAAGLGIDEGTRPELVPFEAKNLANVNVRRDKQGELSKRPGFTALSTLSYAGASPTAGYKMFADRDSLVRIADNTAQVFAATPARWRSLGRVAEAACNLIDLPTLGVGTTTTTVSDIAIANGYIAVAWKNGGTYVAIIDESTGAVVRAPEQVGTSTSVWSPLLTVQDSYIVMVRANTASTDLEAHYLDTSSATTIEAGWVAFGAVLANDVGGVYDVHPLSSSSRSALLYRNTSGDASRLTLKYFTVGGGVLSTQTIDTNSTTPGGICLGSTSTTCWLSWGESTSVMARGQDVTTATVTLATKAAILTMAAASVQPYIVGSTTSAGKARIIVADQATSPIRGATRGVQTTTGAAATDGPQNDIPQIYPVRKGIHSGGRYYALCGVGEVTQRNLILCDFTEDTTYLRPVANPTPGLGSTGSSSQCRCVLSTYGTKIYAAFEVQRSAVVNATTLAAFDFAATSRWQSVTFGNSTYLSGGIVTCYDGARAFESGFLVRPNLPTTGTSGTGITATTGWRYVCVYEEIDADGNWHISGVSSPSASTGAVANKTVTVTTSPLSVSSRFGTTTNARSLRVAFYRTLDGGVAPYYRLGVTINSTAAMTVTFADAVADATLAANAKLYSQPGVPGTAQDRRPPPPFQCIAVYNGMLVGASGSDVWYSGQNVQGEGVWFNPVFQVPIPGEGDVTALWVQDGTLYAAKRRAIFALSGDAPSDNGAGGGLSLPRKLAVDIGALNQRGVCTTALGTFFQSDRGYEIFTRAQAVEWIGESVQATLTSFPVVTSATVEPVSSCVYVELATAESSGAVVGTGRTLVFDLTLRDWVSTDRRKSGAGTADSPSQSACMIYTGTAWRYAWMGANGTVHYENIASWLDADGSFVVSSFETPWLKHGLQSEQRIWAGLALFQRNSAVGMKLETAYDYADYSTGNDKTWTEAETLSGLRQLPFAPKSRGTAMKFRMSDVAPAVLGTGQSFTWIGLSFDSAPKQGATHGITRVDTALRK